MAKWRGAFGRGLLLGGVSALGMYATRRKRDLEQVPADMRSPMLYLPFEVRNRPSLEVARRLRLGEAPPDPAVGISTRVISIGDAPEVPVFVYEPPVRKRASGALLYIHGGGYVSGRAAGYHANCARIAKQLGVLVVNVDYRLAPEHRFPAGLDDCYAALLWMHKTAGELGIDPERIAVGGDSAGGGLAAGLAQLAHDRGVVPVCFQLLIYPMLDDRTAAASEFPGRGKFVWTVASNRFGWASYLGRPAGASFAPAYAVPARREDLSGLPPAWIGVGTLDLFHDEDVEYGRRLQAAGVSCEVQVVPGMYHGADVLAAAHSTAMHDFTDGLDEALRRAIGVVV